jgi:hypothetical protein
MASIVDFMVANIRLLASSSGNIFIYLKGYDESNYKLKLSSSGIYFHLFKEL